MPLPTNAVAGDLPVARMNEAVELLASSTRNNPEKDGFVTYIRGGELIAGYQPAVRASSDAHLLIWLKGEEYQVRGDRARVCVYAAYLRRKMTTRAR